MARKKYILKIIPNDNKVIEEDKESEDFVIYLSNKILSQFETLYNKPQNEIFDDVSERIKFIDKGYEVIYNFSEFMNILDYLPEFINNGDVSLFIFTVAMYDPKIILSHNPSTTSNGGYLYHTQDIEVSFNSNNVVNDIIRDQTNKNKHVEFLLQSIKNSLSHELTHLYDNSISDFKMFEAGKSVDTIYKRDLDKFTKYFEINAYYTSAKQFANEHIHKNMEFDEYYDMFLQNLSIYHLLSNKRKSHIYGRIYKEWEQEIARLRGLEYVE